MKDKNENSPIAPVPSSFEHRHGDKGWTKREVAAKDFAVAMLRGYGGAVTETTIETINATAILMADDLLKKLDETRKD